MQKASILFAIGFLLFSGVTYSQNKKKPLIDPSVKKLGPYFGIQQGRYTVGEIGMEFQHKGIRLKQPKTNAVHLGLGYNIPNNTLQINGGYWHKPSRFDLTYGADICLRSDFDTERFGISPVIGYKVFGFHVRAGYMFLTPSTSFIQTNTLFLNLRFLLVNRRNFSWNKRK
jgi:hypothetical protein